MHYKLTKPCSNCPFRSDIKPYLRSERVHEIADSLVRGQFPCHKTLNYDRTHEECEEPEETENTGHCAGALILLEKLEQPSQMMRICERIGVYDARKLDMDAPVYDSFEDMADAQLA